MSQEQYLFLTSDTVAFSKNSAQKFSTVFNTIIDLASNVEKYEIGISKLLVNGNALNVTDGEFHFYSTALGSSIATRIPNGMYQVPQGLITAFAQAVHPDSADYVLSFDVPIQKFALQTKSDKCAISFSENLQNLLSFPPIVNGARVTFGSESYVGRNIYVMCNNVELSYWGNEKYPLMGVFPYTSGGNVLMFEPQNILYVPLLWKTFQSIDIELKDDKGNLFTFPEGSRTVLVLHIRPAHI